MKTLILISSFLAIVVQVNAQQLIRGKITDDTNASLPGTSIQVKNTLRGTFSDLDGNFSISASPSDTVVFSMVGMAKQSNVVGNSTVIDIKLMTETKALNETIVIGYGTQKVKDLTAPIVSLKGEELSKQLSSNA